MKIAAAFASVAVLLAGTGTAHAHSQSTSPPTRWNPERGVVWDGFVPARANGPCKLGFELRLPDGGVRCSHGPDPAPPGVDARARRPLGDIVALSSGAPGDASGEAAGSVVCVGDGVGGKRVQAVYAYPVGGEDNYDAVAPHIRRWAAIADEVVNESAAETGGVRHVRFVTGPDCELDVAKVALSPEGVSSLAGTTAELQALGFDRPDRKYLVWVDAYVYCGVATVQPDDSPGPTNANNGSGDPGMIGRIDRGCWGNPSSSAEAHELVHILGGVQPTAPHGTWNYHCGDESELMCYDDDFVADGYVGSHGVQVPLTFVCPEEHERLLDCNHDDFFSTSPLPGSWLAEHWNVADSSFLTSGGPPSAPDTAAPTPTAPKPRIVGRLTRGVPVRLEWGSKDADVAGYWLWKSVDGRPWRYVERPDLWESSAQVRLRRSRSYRFLVHAFDADGNASPAVFGRRFRPRVFQEHDRAVTYEGRWRRLYRREASRRHLALPRRGRPVARLAFRGEAVAWVSHTSSAGGTARVFLDGRFAGLVDLGSTRPASRRVVFTERFERWGRHRIAVAPSDGSSAAAVDAFVVLR